MLMLAVILLVCVGIAMFLFGQFPSVKERYAKMLDMQMAVFDKEITEYYENAVICAVNLSQLSGRQIDKVLLDNALTFDKLNDNRKLIVELQDYMFEPLQNALLQANASGAFVIWDTTVNTSIKNAKESRSGLYIKLVKNDIDELSTIVYRGDSGVGKNHGVMPHRKWSLEYQASNMPGFADVMQEKGVPLDLAHRMSKVFELPGTTEKSMLIMLPIFGRDGKVYGACGFEVSQMDFKEKFAQSSTFKRMNCLFLPEKDNVINENAVLNSGIKDGYCYMPKGNFKSKKMAGEFTRFEGNDSEYMGITKSVSLEKNHNESLLVVMIPESDYEKDALLNSLKIWIVIILLVFFAVAASYLFSKKFITPITNALQIIKDGTKNLEEGEFERSGLEEIDELIYFVREKLSDKSALGALPQPIEEAFNRFINSARELTPAERKVLLLVIKGHTAKEIPEILFISESTAKHHLQSIYKKMKVSSRGELLLYIEMLKGCDMINEIL